MKLLSNKFTEKSIAEDYIIKNLIEKGWRFVPANELERESFSEQKNEIQMGKL